MDSYTNGLHDLLNHLRDKRHLSGELMFKVAENFVAEYEVSEDKPYYSMHEK